MIRLLVLVCTFCVIVILLCVVALMWGRAQSNPRLFPSSNQCEVDECILGVVPGSTSWPDATDRFAGLQNAMVVDNSISIQLDPHIQIYFQPSIDQTGVGLATVYFDQKSGPLLGTLISVYGGPCAVIINPSKHFVTVRYRYLIASVMTDPNRTDILLSPRLKISGLSFHSAIDPCITKFQGWVWHGFTSRYTE